MHGYLCNYPISRQLRALNHSDKGQEPELHFTSDKPIGINVSVLANARHTIVRDSHT